MFGCKCFLFRHLKQVGKSGVRDNLTDLKLLGPSVAEGLDCWKLHLC